WRLDVTALADVMNRVQVGDDQCHPASGHGRVPGTRFGREIARRSEPDRVVAERRDDAVDILRRTQIGVTALEHGAHDALHLSARWHPALSEIIENEIGRAVAVRRHGRFVGGPGDREGTVALVEAQARGILLQQRAVAAERRIVGQGLEEDADRIEGERLVARPLVQRTADAAAGPALGRGNEVEIAEAERGVVQQQGKAEYLLTALCNEQDRAEPGVLRLAQGSAEAVDIRRIERRKLCSLDFAYALDVRAYLRR